MPYVPPNLGESAENSAGITSWKTKAKDVAIVCGCLAGLYLGFGWLAERFAAYIPASWESRLSVAPTPPAEDDRWFAEYQKTLHIFEKLRSTEKLREIPYALFLVEMEEPNAFAIPGGGVGVTSGLLEKVTTEPGRAMVLAHEFGHHEHRHTLRRLGRALVFQTAMALLFGQTANPFAEVSVAMAELSYSRDQEREADEFGLRLVKKAYGSTAGTLEFFEMVEKEDLGLSKKWQTMFSSHPITSERIVYLRELSRELDKK
ncbi:MAG: M48 family metallopeptidase [Bdellovibrionaceae bacterium]|nr:M48 family metallopeptidase [Bdellovibrionales bacterium]MCB9254757.1 M48 family metallopeptidase [Pseudobdellovibrionaceae bacterium]